MLLRGLGEGVLESYWSHYVRSKDNLADGPSRGDYELMKQLGAERVELDFSRMSDLAEQWFQTPRAEALMP